MTNPFSSHLGRLPIFVTCKDEVGREDIELTLSVHSDHLLDTDVLDGPSRSNPYSPDTFHFEFEAITPRCMSDITPSVMTLDDFDVHNLLLEAASLYCGGMPAPFSVVRFRDEIVVAPGAEDAVGLMAYLALYHTHMVYSEWPFHSKDFWSRKVTFNDGEQQDPTTGIVMGATRAMNLMLEETGALKLGPWSVDVAIDDLGFIESYGNQEVYWPDKIEPGEDHDWSSWPRFASIKPGLTCVAAMEGTEHAFQPLPIGHDEDGTTWIMGIPAKATIEDDCHIYVDHLVGQVPAGTCEGANPITFYWDEKMREELDENLEGPEKAATLFVAFFTSTIQNVRVE